MYERRVPFQYPIRRLIVSSRKYRSREICIYNCTIVLNFDRHLGSRAKAMRWFKLPISPLRDFPRFYDKTSYRILKWGPRLLWYVCLVGGPQIACHCWDSPASTDNLALGGLVQHGRNKMAKCHRRHFQMYFRQCKFTGCDYNFNEVFLMYQIDKNSSW